MGDSITEGNEPLPSKMKELIKIPETTDASWVNFLDTHYGG